MSPRVLVVDNHDSFVHILIDDLRQAGARVDLVEADAVDAAGLAARLSERDAVLVSPGPGRPQDAGASIEAVRIAARLRMPLLGVCLGHQAIGAAFGAEVAEARELVHGMSSAVRHDGSALFAGIPSPFDAGRYHSLALAAGSVPAELIVTAQTDDSTIMAVAHRELPIAGVQFHPESVLTPHGPRLLANWLATLPSAA